MMLTDEQWEHELDSVCGQFVHMTAAAFRSAYRAGLLDEHPNVEHVLAWFPDLD